MRMDSGEQSQCQWKPTPLKEAQLCILEVQAEGTRNTPRFTERREQHALAPGVRCQSSYMLQ